MREASNEKDLRRLLQNVSMQLDAIRRGYITFKDSQLDLVKQYPEMIKDELKKYRDSVLKFFNIDKKMSKNSLISSVGLIGAGIGDQQLNSSINLTATNVVDLDASIDANRELIVTEKGNKYFAFLNKHQLQASQSIVNLNESLDKQNTSNDDTSSEVLGYDDLMGTNANHKLKFLSDAETKPYLKFTFVPFDVYKEIKNR